MTHPTDIEFQPAGVIKAHQEKLLAQALEYLAARSPFYQDMFRSNRIDVSRIRHLEDLADIPFTTKRDLQLHTDRLLCCPRERIVDYCTTSGTLGTPVTFGCTEADLDRLAYNEAKSFACAGLGPGSVLQLMCTIDKRFMAGLAYFLGIRRLGASVVRVGGGVPELQWDTIRRLRPDTLMCVPSFILRLIAYADEHGIDPRRSSVRRIIGIGESLRNQDFSLNLLGRRIRERWDVELFATYSSTEMSTTFSECPYGLGGHVHPELIITEIIGPDGRPVPDGEEGEVVVTTLGVEAMPLLRFRTGDIAAKRTDPCPCGRNSYRLTPIVGRKHNMIKLKGTTLYPPALDDVLQSTDFVENYVVIATTSDAGTDDVLVRIALNASVCARRLPGFDPVAELRNRFRARLRVAPAVEVSDAPTLQRIVFPAASRKPVRFIDRRKRQ